MTRFKMFVATIFATALFASMALAQEMPRNEVSIQGTGFFTNDTTARGFTQHTTDSGGLLVSYRYNMTRWLAGDGSYGYTRNTLQASAGPVFDIQSNVHQFTGAVVVTTPESIGRFRPFALVGGGVLKFDPIESGFIGIGPLGPLGQSKGTFIYGGGTDVNLSNNVALRLEYRGLVYDRPDFGFNYLNVGRTTHTAQPSAGIVFRF